LETGAPVLDDALVSFDCEIEQFKKLGHILFLFVLLWRSNAVSMTKVWFILIVLIIRWDKQKLPKAFSLQE
jgi:hypothetical protein